MLARIKFELSALAKEIVDKLPPEVFTSSTTTFLDPAMAGGQFLVEIIRRLKDNGHDDVNIATRVFGLAEDKLDLNYAQRKNGVFGQLAVGGIETLENYKNMGKKFDVVIGNPPYQDAVNENTKNIWPLFLKKAFEMVTPGGVVALVTPRTWATNDLYTDLFLTHQPIHINVDECKRHFPGVGSTFSFYVLLNEAPSGKQFTVEGGSGEFTLTSLPEFGLGCVDKTAINILTKVLDKTDKFRMITSSGYNTMKFSKADPTVSKAPTPNHPYKVLHKTKNGVDEFFYSSLLDATEHNVPRVIVNIWVANYDKMVVSDTLLTCEQYRHYPTTTLQEAETLRHVLLSRLYKFIALSLVSGGSHTHKSLSQFPKVDLTRSWTDAELYAHFNLTQDEIDLIEATVK